LKLPAGKVISSESGGEEVLLNMLEGFKNEKFMGYITLSRKKPEGHAIGQVVFKEGVALLADYNCGGAELLGPQSIDSLIEDSFQPDARIEVHGKVDTELMILYFQKAKLDSAKGDLETKLREIVEEFLKEKAERELREQTEQRRNELNAQMDDWVSEGYIVSRLEKALDGDIETMEKGFLDFEGDLGILQELAEKVDSISADGFTKEVEALTPLLKDPDQIPQVNKGLEELEKVMLSKRQAVDKLVSQVSSWDEQGYAVNGLKEETSRPLGEVDVEALKHDIENTKKAITQLKKHEKSLTEFTAPELGGSVEDIKAMLNDPGKVVDITSAISDLKTKITEIHAKKADLVNKVNEWKKEGYNVSRLGEISTLTLEEAEDAIAVMTLDIQRLAELGDELDSFGVTDFKKEVDALKTSLKDPDVVADIESGIRDISGRLEDITQRKSELTEKVSEFTSQGYNTSKLESILDSDLETIEKSFLDFEDAVETLSEFREQLNGLNTSLLPDRVDEIESMLFDPEAIPKVEKAIKKLEADLKNAEAKKSAMVKKVEAIQAEGFTVTRIEATLSGSLISIEEAVKSLESDVGTLKKLKKKVESSRLPDVSDDQDELRQLLQDPDSIESAESKIQELEKKIVKIKARRKEIESKVATWKREGYVTLSVESNLKKGLGELEEVFSDFQSKIDRLKELEGELKSLDSIDFLSEIEAIGLRLKNPDAISVINNILDDMKVRIEENKTIRDEMREKAVEWKDSGFQISNFEKAIDKEIVKAKEVYEEYTSAIDRILDVRTQLELISNERFVKERDEILKNLKDPTRAEDYDKKFTEFSDRINHDTQERATLQANIDEWKAQGMEITQIQKILLEEPIDVVKSSFESFETDIKTLLELQAKLRKSAPSAVETTPPAPDQGVESAPETPEPPVEEPGALTPPPREPSEESMQADAPSPPLVPTKGTDKDLSDATNLLDEYMFKNFVVGTSNRFTHAAAMAVSESPAEAYNPLFIYGGAGLGKTHLLNAIGNHIKETKPRLKVIFLTSEDFTNDLIDAVKSDRLGAFREKYRKADILLIDDIQFLAGKESTQEEFFHTFNALYNAHKQIVITSDRPPKDITTLEEKLKSRFEGGLITDIQPPSLETKIIILRREAKKHNMQIPDEVLHHIASRVVSNIRELEGALVKVAAYSSLINRDISLDLADEALKDMLLHDEGGSALSQDAKQEQNFSSIEERLSTLRKKISPMLSKGGMAEKKKKKVTN